MQKLSLSVLFLAGLLGTSAALPVSATPQSQQSQQSQQTESVNGTISSIGDQGRSFDLDVSNQGKKQTLHFVLDKDTQVKGHVTVGTAVKVDYVAMADQNVAKVITAQAA